jgi:hypothetical protein
MPDLNVHNAEAAMTMVAGMAKSAGITVVSDLLLIKRKEMAKLSKKQKAASPEQMCTSPACA